MGCGISQELIREIIKEEMDPVQYTLSTNSRIILPNSLHTIICISYTHNFYNMQYRVYDAYCKLHTLHHTEGCRRILGRFGEGHSMEGREEAGEDAEGRKEEKEIRGWRREENREKSGVGGYEGGQL